MRATLKLVLLAQLESLALDAWTSWLVITMRVRLNRPPALTLSEFVNLVQVKMTEQARSSIPMQMPMASAMMMRLPDASIRMRATTM